MADTTDDTKKKLTGLGAKSVSIETLPNTWDGVAEQGARYGLGFGDYLNNVAGSKRAEIEQERTAKPKDDSNDPNDHVPMYAKGGFVTKPSNFSATNPAPAPGMATGGLASAINGPANNGPATPMTATANAFTNAATTDNFPTATDSTVSPTISQATGLPTDPTPADGTGGATTDGSVGATGAIGSTGGGVLGSAIGAVGLGMAGVGLGALGLGAFGSTAANVGSQGVQAAFQNSTPDATPVDALSAMLSGLPANSLTGLGTSVADQIGNQQAALSSEEADAFGQGLGGASFGAAADANSSAADPAGDSSAGGFGPAGGAPAAGDGSAAPPSAGDGSAPSTGGAAAGADGAVGGDGASSSAGGDGGSGGDGGAGGCFITTAVCEAQNKPDDCPELQILRAFRDDYVPEELIKEYYEIAPGIVAGIKSKPNSAAILDTMYNDFILPAIFAIALRNDKLALTIYTELVAYAKEFKC